MHTELTKPDGNVIVAIHVHLPFGMLEVIVILLMTFN